MSHGVFSGEVTLTGHPDYDVNEDGKNVIEVYNEETGEQISFSIST